MTARTAALAAALACAARPCVAAGRILVIPFENTTLDIRIYWVG